MSTMSAHPKGTVVPTKSGPSAEITMAKGSVAPSNIAPPSWQSMALSAGSNFLSTLIHESLDDQTEPFEVDEATENDTSELIDQPTGVPAESMDVPPESIDEATGSDELGVNTSELIDQPTGVPAESMDVPPESIDEATGSDELGVNTSELIDQPTGVPAESMDVPPESSDEPTGVPLDQASDEPTNNNDLGVNTPKLTETVPPESTDKPTGCDDLGVNVLESAESVSLEPSVEPMISSDDLGVNTLESAESVSLESSVEPMISSDDPEVITPESTESVTSMENVKSTDNDPPKLSAERTGNDDLGVITPESTETLPTKENVESTESDPSGVTDEFKANNAPTANINPPQLTTTSNASAPPPRSSTRSNASVPPRSNITSNASAPPPRSSATSNAIAPPPSNASAPHPQSTTSNPSSQPPRSTVASSLTNPPDDQELTKARDDAVNLNRAFGGRVSCDTTTLVSILSQRSARHRTLIRQEYKTMFEEDFDDRLSKKLQFKRHLQRALSLWMDDPASRDAKLVKEGLSKHGLHKNLNVAIEVICSRTPSQIEQLKKAYHTMFGIHLLEDIESHTHFDQKKLLLAYAGKQRSEGPEVDEKEVDKDAKALFKDGQWKLGTNEETFIRIFSERSSAHLAAVSLAYCNMYVNSLKKAVKKETSWKFKDALLTILQCAENREKYFAKALYKAVKGMGTDEETLTRIIVTRAEVDIQQINAEYLKKYGKQLSDDVHSDTSRYYRAFLLSLLNPSAAPR